MAGAGSQPPGYPRRVSSDAALAAVLDRLATARPRVAAEAGKPHAEERLLAEVVADLAGEQALARLSGALDVPGDFERSVLWGADPLTGLDDMALAGALRDALPGLGRAALLDAEPDLVVVTDAAVCVVDATIGRPGHAAARARRGEPVPPPVVDAVAAALSDHGIGLSREDTTRHLAAARLTAVALGLAARLDREAIAVALGAPTADLLHPDHDPLSEWAWSAGVLHARGDAAVVLRACTWLALARGLEGTAATRAAVLRIRAHPVVAVRSDAD